MVLLDLVLKRLFAQLEIRLVPVFEVVPNVPASIAGGNPVPKPGGFAGLAPARKPFPGAPLFIPSFLLAGQNRQARAAVLARLGLARLIERPQQVLPGAGPSP